MIFVSGSKLSEQDNKNRKDLSLNERMDIPYKVKYFSPNQITIATDNVSGKPVWMLYSDAWHPSWKAEVNDKSVPIYIGDLAYKVVELKPGENTIHFHFENTLIVGLHRFWSVNAAVWIGILIGLMIKICLNQEEEIIHGSKIT